MIVNLKDLLGQADRSGYAVPAFNYSDIWDMKAILRAAELENAPIMLSSNPLVIQQIGVEFCAAMGRAAMETAKVPVVHHVDHGFSPEMCIAGIDNGYPSVMIDGSKYPLEENIAVTRRVVEYAKGKNVFVEGELGRIKGRNCEGVYVDGEDFLVQVDEAVRFVAETGVNSLAVGIGTAHGFYAGKPEIHFRRLQEINEAIDIPLVLHGGTGIPAEDISRAIKGGINKVNVGTIIHCTYMNGMKRELDRLPENPYTLDVVKPVMEEITEVVRGWIRACGANGRA